MHVVYAVSQLNTEIGKGKKEREAVEKKLSSLQESHGELQSQFDKLAEKSTQQVSITEHKSALKEMHRYKEKLLERCGIVVIIEAQIVGVVWVELVTTLYFPSSSKDYYQ